MFAGLGLSPALWFSDRLYPTIPLVPFLGKLPWLLDRGLYAAMLVDLAIVATASRPARWIALFTGLAVAMVLCDQSRCQPWFYQYVVMLAAVGLYWRNSDDANRHPGLNACRLVVATAYIWSGLQKMHTDFTGRIFQSLIEPFVKHLPERVVSAIQPLGVLPPFIEAAIGLGLFIPRFRTYAAGAGIAMHLTVLLAIGPLGSNSNIVVWPWNAAMICFLLILFWKQPVSAANIVAPRGLKFRIALIVLFCVAPALSFFNLWDEYLSYSLYAGRRNEPFVYVTNALADRLPKELLRYVYLSDTAGVNHFDVREWSMTELRVPIYPEPRAYKVVARRLCSYERAPGEIKLVIRRSRILFARDGEDTYDCQSLKR